MTESEWENKIETTRVTEKEWEKKDSQNKSQWHRVIDNTKLRPQEWQRITKDKWQTKKTRINDREWLTTQGRQRKWETWIDNTRVNDTEGYTTQDIETTRVTETESGKRTDRTRDNDRDWVTIQDWDHKGDRELVRKNDRQKARINDREWLTTQGRQRKLRKMDWQNKSQWHWGVDNTRYWDHKSDREKCVWKRIDRRRVNDQRVTENRSSRPQGWQRTSEEQGLTTEQESIRESDKVTKPEWKPEEVWDRSKDSEHNYEKQQREQTTTHKEVKRAPEQ